MGIGGTTREKTKENNNKKNYEDFIVSNNEEILAFQLAECSVILPKGEGKGGGDIREKEVIKYKIRT